MKVATVVAAVLLLCIALLGSIQAKFEKPKYCVGKDGKHYLRGEHYEDKKGETCIRYTCVRKGKKLKMNKKKISCDEPPPDVMANVTALEASIKSLQTSVESILEMVTALQFRSSQLEINVTTNIAAIKDDISTNVASLATKCDASTCYSLQTTATDIESCLADITSSTCPPPPSGKTGVAGGISGNTAALADKCDASTCSDIQTTVENLERNVTTNKDTININKGDISTNVASLATKCDTSSCTSLQNTATDIESCLADITSSACPPPPSGKTSVAEGIANNTAVLDHKCDASTCKDIENMVLNLGSSTETTTTTMTTTTTTKAQTVLWIAGTNDKTLETLKLPDFTPVNASCKVPNPNMNLLESNIQEIQGKLYSCDHRLCQTYSAEDNTWTTIPGKKFKFQRRRPAGTVIGDKWIIQGGWVLENGKTINVATTEVWSPGTGNWVEAPQYKSPLPVSAHCVVNINGKIMQIGGRSHAPYTRTGKCFVDGGEVASLKAPRNVHSCAVFHGEVWVAGGYREDKDNDARVVEIYDPQSNSWAEGAKLPGEIKKDYNPLLLTYEGNLYYVGGGSISKIYKLNIDQSKWEEVGDIAKGEKFGHIVNTKIC